MGDLVGRAAVGHGGKARRRRSGTATAVGHGGRQLPPRKWASTLRVAAALKCPSGHSRVHKEREGWGGGKSL
ncbi:hypothetical protein R1flu_014674 [Riccia fluitans]|uniref:Uncharacterized protein n=1 Tax=Riccia fluitans TaxID=41844 RepID=A0ABD1YGS2_9MARC